MTHEFLYDPFEYTLSIGYKIEEECEGGGGKIKLFRFSQMNTINCDAHIHCGISPYIFIL